MRGDLPTRAVSGGAPAGGGGASGRDRDDVAPAVGARGGPGVLLGCPGGTVGVAQGESVNASRRGMCVLVHVNCYFYPKSSASSVGADSSS